MPSFCPHCGTTMLDTPELAGQEVTCSSCGGHFVMPGAPAPAPAPSPFDIQTDSITEQSKKRAATDPFAVHPDFAAPHGRPSNTRGKRKPTRHEVNTGYAFLIVIGGFIGVMIATLWITSSNSPAPVKHSSRKLDAWIMAQDFVESELKAPSTASYGSILNDYQDPDDVVQRISDSRYIVRAWVDSQNGFGAMLRTHFTCEVEHMGGQNWRCHSLAFD